LLALEMVCELQNLTGRKLDPEILFKASSVRAIAAEILNGETVAPKILTPLQLKGTEPPLIFFHTTPGDVLGYGSLVFHLGFNQPCHGFQSPGMLDPQDLPQSIEEMAGRYVEILIREFKGPYRLIGWCYGGILAFEAARQLKSRNLEVEFVGLIETPAPRPVNGLWRYYWSKLWSGFGMSFSQATRYAKEKFRYYSGVSEEDQKRFKRLRTIANLPEEAVRERNQYLETLEKIYTSNLKVLNRYQAPFYSGRIHLFNAVERDPAQLPDPYYGWKPLVEEVLLHQLPGDHNSILQEPNVRLLAQAIHEQIRK
jgi:thioesterase domain-containing protein